MKKRIILLPAIAIFLFLTIGCEQSEKKSAYTPIPSETGPLGEHAMVSSAHPLATKVGTAVLSNGGNAFDAAVAVKFALAVVFPRAGNIGGGGFVVYRDSSGAVGSLDFREKAPLAADRNMYLDEDGNVIQGLSTKGHLAAGVPGSVDGILTLHQEKGSMPLADLIQPSIEIARQGFAITQDQADEFNEKKEDFTEINGADFFLVNEDGWNAGDTIKFSELAETFIQIRDNGRAGFYEGIVAEKIVAEMQEGGGLITLEDLANYQTRKRAPVIGKYRGHKIISMPPPSSGGVALLQLLQGAEAYDIKSMGHNTAQTIHVKTELERRVYADRATYLGDPDYYDVPVDMLLNPGYNADRFSTISQDQKSSSQDIKEGEVEVIESVETTHISIIDPFGNAVSLTTTLNSFFGCKVYVEGAGFFLNNEMDDFSAKPGVANQFGLVGGEANAIIPEKRMLSSMTPTIVEKNGELKMVLGTPGGSTIITSIFQAIMNVIDHEMGMQDAVNATRIHSQWLPDLVLIEKRPIDPKEVLKLEEMGHEIRVRETMGRMDCILIREDGLLEGGADYQRGDNYAEGF